jgi:hypothetical protein
MKITEIKIVKGMKVKLNKEWSRANDGSPSKSLPVGLAGEITGFAVQPACVRVRFLGRKTSQTFHISFLDVQ